MAVVLGRSLPLVSSGNSRAMSFLLKGRGCLIYTSRKEIGHGKVARSDESGFGVKEPESSNAELLFNLGEEFCSSFSSVTGGDGRPGDPSVSSLSVIDKFDLSVLQVGADWILSYSLEFLWSLTSKIVTWYSLGRFTRGFQLSVSSSRSNPVSRFVIPTPGYLFQR